MLTDKTNAPEARFIYVANNILRKYRVNFYYSLRKDAVFIFEGRSVKSILYPAYFFAASGGILFLFSFLFYPEISVTPVLFSVVLTIASLSSLAGFYILFDFYRKIKYNKTKTMILRNGISFRNNNEFEFWGVEKIKSMEPILTISKKDVMKTGNRNRLSTEGRIILFNHIGQRKDLLSIENIDKRELKDDLEMIHDTIQRFMTVKNKANTQIAWAEEKMIV